MCFHPSCYVVQVCAGVDIVYQGACILKAQPPCGGLDCCSGWCLHDAAGVPFVGVCHVLVSLRNANAKSDLLLIHSSHQNLSKLLQLAFEKILGFTDFMMDNVRFAAQGSN